MLQIVMSITIIVFIFAGIITIYYGLFIYENPYIRLFYICIGLFALLINYKVYKIYRLRKKEIQNFNKELHALKY